MITNYIVLLAKDLCLFSILSLLLFLSNLHYLINAIALRLKYVHFSVVKIRTNTVISVPSVLKFSIDT